MDSGKPRFRISTKQTTKNLWQLDGTVEHEEMVISVSSNDEDVAEIEKIPVGKALLTIIKQTEDEFRKDGRKLVSDLEGEE